MSACPTAWCRQPDPEYPYRPHVRDIYDAQRRGFPIFDHNAFEIYRIALTSVRELNDDPKVEEILRPLARAARQWMAQHADNPADQPAVDKRGMGTTHTR
jgi:hypothetical protein